MRRVLQTILLVGFVAGGLAACRGGGGDKDVVVAPPPPAKLEDGFGPGFAAAYQAPANSDPREPTAADLNAVSVTTKPTPIN